MTLDIGMTIIFVLWFSLLHCYLLQLHFYMILLYSYSYAHLDKMA